MLCWRETVATDQRRKSEQPFSTATRPLNVNLALKDYSLSLRELRFSERCWMGTAQEGACAKLRGFLSAPVPCRCLPCEGRCAVPLLLHPHCLVPVAAEGCTTGWRVSGGICPDEEPQPGPGLSALH